MSIFKRILGICETKSPRDAGSWNHASGRVEIDLNRVPELSQPGSAVRLEGSGLPERVLVVHGNDGEFRAFRNKCMHMGRRIDPLAGASEIRCCSISKATYGYAGQVISGPAKGPLTTYQVQKENEKLTILLGDS
jgi:nitrite reductase/ring-hydroxylating ferredoxin subunit